MKILGKGVNKSLEIDPNISLTKIIIIIIIAIIIIKTSSTGPSEKNKTVYKLFSQPHKLLRHGKLKKTQSKKGKVIYGQEPPSGESTTTECGFTYQLLVVITEVAQWGAPSCSQPQPATDNGVRDGRSN